MRNTALRLLVSLPLMLVSGTAMAAGATLSDDTGGYHIALQVGSADHNLAVSVLNEKTNQPVMNADVSLYVQALDRNGEPGPLMSIPVVKTQAIGAGAALYGSNQRLNPGHYRINATVGGMDLIFFTDV